MAKARLLGFAVSVQDALIAATALSQNLTVATRDTDPFEFADCAIINPWKV